MAGGLMNLVSEGTENIILNGNPKKTFFKATYNKYTNFGMQKFRLDYDGQRKLQYDQDTEMIFKVPRYGDLLFDTYVVVDLPNIWSPLYWNTDVSGNWAEFQFRWIDNLGAEMIRQVSVYSGGTTLAQYPGEWLYDVKERDYNNAKSELWDKMIGNVPELNDPANVDGLINIYPNALNDGSCNQIEPSIRGRQLYIPLGAWFCGSGKMALPLVSIQYQEVYIKVTFRPICDLFRIRDVTDVTNGFPYISPRLSTEFNNIWRFLNPSRFSATDASQNFYPNRTQDWNADIHLLANYVFLSDDERRMFAQEDQKYLIKETHAYDYLNVTGSSTVELKSRDMVASYMWRFRRSDANLRNEWTNYSNWAYESQLPVPPDNSGANVGAVGTISPWIFYYKCLHTENIKNILVDLAIIMDGKYREDVFSSGLWNYVEKYLRTTGNAKDGLYCYNFCLNSNQREYQPSGAMNVNKFNKINFEFNTIEPPLNPTIPYEVICDPSGAIIGVRKNVWQLNDYNFDLRIYEERYNVLVITGGQIGLMYAR
jgi:hypothetical protein